MGRPSPEKGKRWGRNWAENAPLQLLLDDPRLVGSGWGTNGRKYVFRVPSFVLCLFSPASPWYTPAQLPPQYTHLYSIVYILYICRILIVLHLGGYWGMGTKGQFSLN